MDLPWKDKERNRTFIREYGKKWRPAHPGFRNKSNWRARGIDPGKAESVYRSKNRCEVCGGVLLGSVKHLDHSHETNEIRGVLCRNCNQALGHFKEDPRIIESAIGYLTNGGGHTVSPSLPVMADSSRSRMVRRKRIHHRSEWRALGLDVDECERLYESTSSCDLCGVSFAKLSQKCLDHNHLTKKVRGILCANCNFALGKMEDNPNLVMKLKVYLARS